MPRQPRLARPAPAAKNPSADESQTKALLIEVAGQLFAEVGADRATGKEVCARAKVNAASINYHFGSFDGLRAAVLVEAHRRLASLEALRAAVAHADGPEGKLAAVLRLIVGTLTGPVAHSWVIRVLAKEIASPSAAFEVLRKQEAMPKFGVIRGIVAELMELPPDHPAVARGCVSVMGPCAMLLLVDRTNLKRMFPALGVSPADADDLAGHLIRVAVTGLRAVAADVRRSSRD